VREKQNSYQVQKGKKEKGNFQKTYFPSTSPHIFPENQTELYSEKAREPV
jgi:hypothetical protein